jgi:hypothetical protein
VVFVQISVCGVGAIIHHANSEMELPTCNLSQQESQQQLGRKSIQAVISIAHQLFKARCSVGEIQQL